MKIIGIGGGSGSGKSTVSYALVDADPDKFEVINLDDYQKLETEPDLPMLEGMINWDHPDIIEWDKLIADIHKLKSHRLVTIQTWAHRSNPDYVQHRQMIPRIIQPKPVLIVEGYLALYNPELNRLYDKKFYFDLDEITRNSRRDKEEVIAKEHYFEKVLNPMHHKYVEPTKNNANLVIDVASLTVDQIKQKILSQI